MLSLFFSFSNHKKITIGSCITCIWFPQNLVNIYLLLHLGWLVFLGVIFKQWQLNLSIHADHLYIALSALLPDNLMFLVCFKAFECIGSFTPCLCYFFAAVNGHGMLLSLTNSLCWFSFIEWGWWEIFLCLMKRWFLSLW